METKQPKLMTSRAEIVVAALVVVASVAAGSAVLAQDLSGKPAAPPAADKMGMDRGGSGMMGMGPDGNGMMGKMSGMQQMKCCEKQDEKK